MHESIRDDRIIDDLDIKSPQGQDLAKHGRYLIEMAEKEMPGLMALRSEYESSKPLKEAWCLSSAKNPG